MMQHLRSDRSGIGSSSPSIDPLNFSKFRISCSGEPPPQGRNYRNSKESNGSRDSETYVDDAQEAKIATVDIKQYIQQRTGLHKHERETIEKDMVNTFPNFLRRTLADLENVILREYQKHSRGYAENRTPSKNSGSASACSNRKSSKEKEHLLVARSTPGSLLTPSGSFAPITGSLGKLTVTDASNFPVRESLMSTALRESVISIPVSQQTSLMLPNIPASEGATKEDAQRMKTVWDQLSPPLDEHDEQTCHGILPAAQGDQSEKVASAVPSFDISEFETADAGVDEDSYRFMLWSGWDKRKFRKSRREMSQKSPSDAQNWENMSDSDSSLGGVCQEHGEDVCGFTYAMIHPHSSIRLIWDLLSTVLVAYECIMCPMQILALPEVGFLLIMTWTLRIFWTLDLLVSFQTGYAKLDQGGVEMRIKYVVLRYVKTWFFLDALLLCSDWAEEMVATSAEINTSRPILKILRLVRMVRLLRVLRVLAVTRHSSQELTKMLQYYLRSELFHIVIGLLKMMILLLWFCHCIACFWLGLGETDAGDTWINEYGYRNSDMTYTYALSYHWALTQFAGNIEIYPTSQKERVYGIVVLFLSFIIAAWFVSSVTSAMTRLEIVTAEQTEKLMVLRRYLVDHSISRKVSVRVLRNVQRNMEKKKRHAENAIGLFAFVSPSLQSELNFEINSPVLVHHPFFAKYLPSFTKVMKLICNSAVTQAELVRSDIIFEEDEAPVVPKMYFIREGRLTYIHAEGSKKKIFDGDWACEPALWCPWVHCGNLQVTSTTATLSLLDSQVLQKEIAQRTTNDAMPVLAYATGFVEALNQIPPDQLSDLDTIYINLTNLVSEVCPDMVGRSGSKGSEYEGFGTNISRAMSIGLKRALTGDLKHLA